MTGFYTFWSLDPRRVRRVSHTSDRRRYAPLMRRSICLRLDMALKRSICPAGRGEKAQSTLVAIGNISNANEVSIYRLLAMRANIELRSNISTHRRCFISSSPRANLTSLCEGCEQNFTVSVANNFTTSESEQLHFRKAKASLVQNTL